MDVARSRAEQRYARTDQHRHAGDHQAVDESSREESLNGDPAVDISVLETARSELVYDFGWLARHLLDHAFDRGEIERTTAEHDHRHPRNPANGLAERESRQR